MNEQITGFNPGLAVSNIKQFASEVEGAYRSLQSAVGDFSFSLSENWASNKAVDFKNAVKPMFDDLFKDMNDTSLSIQRGAIEAYNAAARANGSATISDFSEGFFDATDFADFFDKRDGKVGMNIEKVTAILTDFEHNMSACADQIGNIPTAIALYDSSDGQQRAYATGINRFKDKVISVVQSVHSYVTNAITEEANVVFQSAQSATSTLNG